VGLFYISLLKIKTIAMKKLFTLFALLLCLTNIKAQFVTIPDANFVTWLQANVPSAMIGNQMDTTSLVVTTHTNISIENLGITDITGIQYFDSLKVLDCGNGSSMPNPNAISSIPILPSSLESLICGDNQITLLPLLPNNLKTLKCYSNLLTSIPTLSNSLDTLDCYNNAILNLPTLPTSLRYLNCAYCQLTTLPALPNSLTYLDCQLNQIINLPTLPITIRYLDCNNNSISVLPILPNSLKYFYCYVNQISSLPTLPNTLYQFDCGSNLLTNLPSLPNTITVFSCGGNQLTSLPTLPDSLIEFYCCYNQLSNLPALPNSLSLLGCWNNQLTSLPILPLSIAFLSCQFNQITLLPQLPVGLINFKCYNNNITCFPLFPNTLSSNIPPYQFNISNNPFTCLPNYVPAMDSATLNYPLCLPGNSNGCNTASGIVGFTYKDNNTNCSKDAGDNGLKNIPLQLYSNAGNLLGQTYSALNGVYQFPQTANTYTVAIDTTGLPFTSSCLFPGLDSTVTVATLDTNINFALTCKPGFDVGVQSISTNGIIFPGQNHVLNVNAGDISHWYNLNCASGTSGILSFSVNGPVTYLSSAAGALTPTVAGNVYTYNIADFGAINNSTDFQLLFQTDVTAQAGDVICVNATVTPTSGDNNPNNNTYTACYNVVNSHDPNIKETYPENVQPGFNDWLTYTIHFQNTGNAPAFNIRLADTLDTMLDLETFQVINYSHPNLIDLTGRVLNVRFPNIQLPDSTTNSAGSIGFIQYRAKPKATWVSPYQIKNTAYIYFDYNAPIITNTTLNTILIPTGLKNQTETVMNLYPNPSNGNFTIELNTKEKQSIQVFDITGNVVISQSIENGKAIIDGSHLAAGIYNINIKGSNSVANKKLVIVR
jgi:uncharacterized repeat protein (TIGR01451 family)